ncbi:hypothetical protein FQR65_LT17216 [Abscondita terminalis]|nr:hypothetical protein FQR65_LT17216 [Abscondita terminalis]
MSAAVIGLNPVPALSLGLSPVMVQPLVPAVAPLNILSSGVTLLGIPAADVLVKGCCSVEHIVHPGYALGIPVADVLVKGCCSVEHIVHPGYALGIPVADVLIKGCCAIKHTAHIGYVGGIPVADVLIKGCAAPTNIQSYWLRFGYSSCRYCCQTQNCIRENIRSSIGYALGIPVADILVKSCCIPKHTAPFGYALGYCQLLMFG